MVYAFVLTSIISAFLVFLIQPMVAKVMLPMLGGTPAVWNGCMLFFQALLLAGYSYAHVLTTRAKIKHQPKIHLALLLAAVLSFPIAFDRASSLDPAEMPIIWLMLTLLTSVGLPYFVITATSPILQKWFSYTDHKDAKHPYFLYAASNIGSMASLVLYPIAFEPFMVLANQLGFWEFGIYSLFAAFLLVAFIFTKRLQPAFAGAEAIESEHEKVEDNPISWPTRFYWLILAFVPSSLLYGVTTFMTTDIASVPMLWVLPLALYLVTFILVFEKNLFGFELCKMLHPWFVLCVIILISIPIYAPVWMFGVHIVTFFVCTMAMHGMLSIHKPAPRYLTEFFFWMSLGGVLGGIFNTLVAPFIFYGVAEYPLALVLSVMLRAPIDELISDLRKYGLRFLIGGAFLIGGLWILWQYNGHQAGSMILGKDAVSENIFADILLSVTLFTLIFLTLMTHKRFAIFGLGLGLASLGMNLLFTEMLTGKNIIQKRSIFGVNRVTVVEDVGHLFIHGSTLHGLQRFAEGERLKPAAYYSGLYGVFDAVDPAIKDDPVAIVGIGAGTLACLGKEGQQYDLYDIDPQVVEIASDPELFTYMRDCPPEKTVLIGDGRQKMMEQDEQKYGVIIMDAFSSDAIPAHLITQEAIELYLTKLKDEGIILFHISNRHIELRPVLGEIANAIGLNAYHRFIPRPEDSKPGWYFDSLWVMMSKSDKALARVTSAEPNWKKLEEYDARYLWRDDFSNLLYSLRFMNPYFKEGMDSGAASEAADDSNDEAAPSHP